MRVAIEWRALDGTDGSAEVSHQTVNRCIAYTEGNYTRGDFHELVTAAEFYNAVAAKTTQAEIGCVGIAHHIYALVMSGADTLEFTWVKDGVGIVLAYTAVRH